MLRFWLTISLVMIAVTGTQAVRRSTRAHHMPYAAESLDKREAAAHLLDRFTFGPTPGQIDDILAEGIEAWFGRQLEAIRIDEDLGNKLASLRSLDLTNEEILRLYPRPGQVRRQAVEEGRIDPDLEPKAQRRALRDYYKDKGYRPQRELVGELIAQKVFRAIESPSQIEEVMVDFWFNHFYVSATDNQCRRFIGTYERDAIRPHVFTRFDRMLEAVAKNPAMLLYLDNAQSSAPDGAQTTMSVAQDELRKRGGQRGRQYREVFKRMDRQRERRRRQMEENLPVESRPRRGINENYARELLELHTLGVDGGYTQEDVVDVARAFTGWTVLPDGKRREKIRERMERHRDLGGQLGFVIEGDFFFNAEWHDAGEKFILGHRFFEGGGLEEGERVLDMLTRHPSTAHHIAHKLSVRFISDDPPPAFIDDLADVFLQTDGDMRSLLWQIVGSEAFWSEAVRGDKIKSPFELAASSVRALGAEVDNPRQLVKWIDRMGQPLYRYQAPTGFPDRAEAWVNAGALLHRMNFGMTLASGKVRGVRIDLNALLDWHEPESPDAALATYAALLLPERNLDETVRVLQPMVGQREVADQIRDRSRNAGDGAPSTGSMMDDASDPFAEDDEEIDNETDSKTMPPVTRVAHIVGLILGSPEFQRR